MRSPFVTALTLAVSSVNAQWHGPYSVMMSTTVMENFDRYWVCSGPCCEDPSPSGDTIVYYDGVNRDAYPIQGSSEKAKAYRE